MWRRNNDPIARLRKRLDAFGSTMDGRHVVEPAAIRDAEDVLAAVSRTDPSRFDEATAEAVFLVACLYWYRFQVLPPGRREADLDEAVRLTELLLATVPSLVPPSLLAMLKAHGPSRRPAPGRPAANAPGRPAANPVSGRPAAGTSPEGAMALFLEAAQLMGKAEQSGDYRDADRAADLLRRAVAATPAGDPARLHYVSALGRVHRDLFLRGGRKPQHLRRAVELHRESLDSTPAGDRERPVRMFNLGNVLGDTFELDGDRSTLDESIVLLGDSARVAGADPRIRAMAQANLGQRLRDRWRLRHDPADLDRAADALTAAVGSLGDPRLAAVLGTVLADRFLRAQDPADRDAAIEAFRAALASGSLDPQMAGVARIGLAALLGDRHERGDDPDDLDAAIDAYLAAAETGPDQTGPDQTGPDRAGLQHAAGKLLEARYARDRRGEDLNDAIHLQRLGVDGAPDDVERGVRLVDLAYTVGHWHAALPGIDGRGLAEESLREAERLLPAGHPGRPDALNNLGNLWREDADRTGAADRLEPAAALLREAVAAAEPSSPKLPLYQSNLSLVLQALFARTQDLATLTEAVEVLREALPAVPAGHPDRLVLLTNFGSALNRRAETVIDAPGAADAAAADVTAAVAALREAAEQARQGAEPEEAAASFGTLALANLLRYQVTGETEALDEAIAALSSAREVAGDGPDRHRLLTNLGNALLLRSRLDGRAADRPAALQAYRDAPLSLPAGHAEQTMCLINLALALEEEPGHENEALAGLREAAGVEAAPSVLRAIAAQRYAALAERLGDLATALDGYALAIELIDLVAWHGMDQDDQARLLTRFAGLAGAAAACAIAAGRPERAVELLEYGRGVLLTRVRDGRAGLDALRDRAPELAARFAAVQAELDGLAPAAAETPWAAPAASSGAPAASSGPAATSSGAPATSWRVRETPWRAPASPLGAPERRHELAVRRRETLAEIRRLPGFEGFLRPPSFADLTRAAAHGPVVLVNVAARRCDALLVDDAGIRVVPLPELAADDLVIRTIAFLAALGQATAPGGADPVAERRRLAARATVTGTLDWLWRVVARPVLDETGAPARLWWCPTGLLSLLPLHAAGPPAGDGVLDRVVPSYTASLRELLRAGESAATESAGGNVAGGNVAGGNADAESAAGESMGEKATGSRGGLVDAAVFVGMPKTPGLADLPGVAREEASVTRYLSRVEALTGPAATRDAVLAALAGHPAAHLSCHGAQDLAAPALGRLALADGSLFVRDLWALRPSAPAGLAVLSACETARVGATLPDETISLGTAFQIAGFRHVIGSLWSISDTITARLCDRLYDGLAVPGEHGRIDPERAAVALHRAVQEIRQAVRDAPELWAAYAHIGP